MARSPVWNRGSMLMPCVVTYTVPPPSPLGHRSQTAVSTSAARALRLTALRAAFIGRHRTQEGRGGREAAPPCPRRRYWTTVRPNPSKASKEGLSAVSQFSTIEPAAHAVLTAHV